MICQSGFQSHKLSVGKISLTKNRTGVPSVARHKQPVMRRWWPDSPPPARVRGWVDVHGPVHHFFNGHSNVR